MSSTFNGRFGGHEWFKAELDLYLWEVAGKYKVKIEMVDFAGNELDPPYEEEVDGWFGGVLRMLEALWEFILNSRPSRSRGSSWLALFFSGPVLWSPLRRPMLLWNSISHT